MTEDINKELNPCLYILMRSDMDSMNSGKGMAQSSHAASAFASYAFNQDRESIDNRGLDQWMTETRQGFGTVVVLDGGDLETISQELEIAHSYGCWSEMIHDPSYPIQDGDVTHYIPIDTCGYIFADRDGDMGRELSQRYNRHP